MAEKQPLYVSPGEPKKRGFEDLDCYQHALATMAAIHEIVKHFPADEKYDLVSQIRRSSKSVTANIAEGYGRYRYLDSLHRYSIARGELNETLAHLINANVLGYIDQKAFEKLYHLIRQTEQTLNGYMAFVRRKREGAQDYGDKAVHEVAAEYDVDADIP
jgi:four helix bundle protein